MKTLGVGLLLVSFAILSFPALGAPGGELDATFGQNGRLIMNEHQSGAAVVQQPADGKLIIAGTTAGDAEQPVFAVLRLNTDGSLDDSFGDQGVAAIAFGDGTSSATAVELQTDGKIVVAGTAQSVTGGQYDLAVARLNPDGTLDATFDADGRVIVAGAGVLLHVALAQDGGVRLIGRLDGVIALVRLTSNGSPDLAFGIHPIPGTRLVPTADLPGSTGFESVGVARQADGAYIVCGTDYAGGADYYWYGWYARYMQAIRLLADGSLDVGFGSGGLWQLEDGHFDSIAGACTVSADGNILVAGRVDSYPTVVKVRPDGVTDASVWTSGIALLDVYGSADSLVTLVDGDLALIGRLDGPGGSSMYVARINSVTGMLDPGFGDHGIATVDFGQGHLQSFVAPQRLIEQSDGKLVAVATVQTFEIVLDSWSGATPALAVARIDPNGAGNNGFVGLSSAVHFVDEGELIPTEVAIAVYRTGGSSGTYLVDYETRAASASPSDYLATTGTLVWAASDMASKLINVRIAADALNEPTESFEVALMNPTGALAQDVTSVVIYDALNRPDIPTYTKGGGGAFGFEVLLLLLCALNKRCCGAVRQFMRFSASRRPQLLASLLLVAAAGPAQSQVDSREYSWDIGLNAMNADDASVSGPAGTSISMKGDSGWGFWANFNITSRLAIGVEWSQRSPDVETRYVEDRNPLGLGPIATIRHQADIENIHLKGTVNFLERDVTPFVEIGVGWTKLDSGIDLARAADLDTLFVDWYDPWWGHVFHPAAVPGRYQGTNTTITYALGVRWDMSTRYTLRADYGRIEGHQVSAVTGSAEPESLRLGFGWRF